MIHDLHFWILTCLHKYHSFSLALRSKAIAINELGSIAPKLHIYTLFFLFQCILHKIFIKSYTLKVSIVSFFV